MELVIESPLADPKAAKGLNSARVLAKLGTVKARFGRLSGAPGDICDQQADRE
jgi:hypothetical protein